MSWTLVFTDQYNRRAVQSLKRHLQQCEQYRKTVFLFVPDYHRDGDKRGPDRADQRG